jgi:hypothetical protein
MANVIIKRIFELMGDEIDGLLGAFLDENAPPPTQGQANESPEGGGVPVQNQQGIDMSGMEANARGV